MSLLLGCYCRWWWWLGQYAMSGDLNSIQLRDKLTPDPRHGSSVVMSDCNGHVRSAPSPRHQQNFRDGPFSAVCDITE